LAASIPIGRLSGFYALRIIRKLCKPPDLPCHADDILSAATDVLSVVVFSIHRRTGPFVFSGYIDNAALSGFYTLRRYGYEN
jgi:hypothetical protein